MVADFLKIAAEKRPENILYKLMKENPYFMEFSQLLIVNKVNN
jgi:hypothetical protein